ncbi:conserved hypothetical protein [Altererythrobacter sp. B11]|uniref:hypothetical protein n=1 Tax=Altererythrobacter sp. B11 TaxID=2060312 RepID=UPI000DC73BEF|nr:hypothetical protein [Altererythrobacter sp. B11]BBC71963.1 conserved hypothetical protein [Altererythrobacter sp. B11]
MYHYIDRPLGQLAAHEQFLVASMRRWVMARHMGRCAVRAAEPLFRMREAQTALGAFHCLMSVLACHAACPLSFAAPCCLNVSEGEALLLSLIEAAREVPQEELTSRCEGVIGADRAVELAFVVDRLAGALAEAG